MPAAHFASEMLKRFSCPALLLLLLFVPCAAQAPAFRSAELQASKATLPIAPFLFPNCPHTFEVPPLRVEVNGLRVLVDFVVNKAGLVESPLILESSGPTNEKFVLNAIQQWRLQPATCNGMTQAIEVRVLFLGPRKRLPHPIASLDKVPASLP